MTNLKNPGPWINHTGETKPEGIGDAVTEFEDKLASLVSNEVLRGAEGLALVTERLTHSLGVTIAMHGGGDAAKSSETLIATEGYLAECVSDSLPMARAMTLLAKS